MSRGGDEETELSERDEQGDLETSPDGDFVDSVDAVDTELEGDIELNRPDSWLDCQTDPQQKGASLAASVSELTIAADRSDPLWEDARLSGWFTLCNNGAKFLGVIGLEHGDSDPYTSVYPQQTDLPFALPVGKGVGISVSRPPNYYTGGTGGNFTLTIYSDAPELAPLVIPVSFSY